MNIIKIKKFGILSALLAFTAMASDISVAASKYVRAGATGNNSGSDWTNAYTGLPAVLTRGDTYYLADGSYGSYTFDDPNSGSTTITIKKATVADHGTETGWNSAYGDGQATFGGYIAFLSSNWVFDGVSGSDYVPGHGFVIDNSSSNNTTLILFGEMGGKGVSNVTVSHIDLYGRGYNQTTVNDRGFYSNSTSSTTSNLTISHNYISGVGVPFLTRQVNTMLVEYNQIEGNHSQPESHGEPWSDTGTDNVVFRYNKVKNPEGTAVFFIGNGSAGDSTNSNTSSNWQLYGNIFYYQNYVVGSGHNAGVSAVLWCPPSSGYGGDTYCHNWMIYNNTFYDFSHGSSSGRILARAGTGVTIPLVQGNIWDSSSDGANHTDVNASYNYYRNTTHSKESNEQIGSSSPFVNAANADFHLSGSLEVATISPLSGFTVNATDMAGVVRGGDGIWDRGAFEYSGQSVSNTLNPPVNLRIQ